jgi:cytochrome c oxidase cbb3-type subunit 3
MSERRTVDPIQGEIVHEYDGIQEADNRLPMWWLWTFYAAIIFSIGYWFYYEEFESAPGLAGQYLEDKLAQAAKTGREPTDGELLALAAGEAKAEGQRTFVTMCAPCHEAQGQGKIGPNLTDSAWLHGGSPRDVFRSIRDGVPEKGMPAWGATLGSKSAQQLTAFVLSIRDTNVPGKASEGEPYDPQASAIEADEPDTKTAGTESPPSGPVVPSAKELAGVGEP